ncbi:hypothetical protein Moror_11541 [Moniliophthora roreri MCA 2997]|uniref:Uncharacterized protein n=1 Tax=Moniliophthora roreri (strain MCA 2997) TaxID=1381753 RepID=V2WUW5_MONRO|nr:hypothetical protein Moror_11541 [Moniliophthora roreri MCA 2997]
MPTLAELTIYILTAITASTHAVPIPNLDLVNIAGPISARQLPNVGLANIGDISTDPINARGVGLVNLGDVKVGSIMQLPKAELVNGADIATGEVSAPHVDEIVVILEKATFPRRLAPFRLTILLRALLAQPLLNVSINASGDVFASDVPDVTAPPVNHPGRCPEAYKLCQCPVCKRSLLWFMQSFDGLLQSVNSSVGGTFTSAVTPQISITRSE